jgi:hypothetical protein
MENIQKQGHNRFTLIEAITLTAIRTGKTRFKGITIYQVCKSLKDLYPFIIYTDPYVHRNPYDLSSFESFWSKFEKDINFSIKRRLPNSFETEDVSKGPLTPFQIINNYTIHVEKIPTEYVEIKDKKADKSDSKNKTSNGVGILPLNLDIGIECFGLTPNFLTSFSTVYFPVTQFANCKNVTKKAIELISYHIGTEDLMPV